MSTPDPLQALPSWYVSLPLADLQDLMASAQRIPELERELKRCYDQLEAVRGIQIQLMDKYQELYKLL